VAAMQLIGHGKQVLQEIRKLVVLENRILIDPAADPSSSILAGEVFILPGDSKEPCRNAETTGRR